MNYMFRFTDDTNANFAVNNYKHIKYSSIHTIYTRSIPLGLLLLFRYIVYRVYIDHLAHLTIETNGEKSNISSGHNVNMD